MAGTAAGGRKAAQKNLEKDPTFYSRIGTKGGEISRGGGFAYGEKGREIARIAGAKGGKISKRK